MKAEDTRIRLEYFNGKRWTFVKLFPSEAVAWMSLGGDDLNYRTLHNGTKEVLTSKKP